MRPLIVAKDDGLRGFYCVHQTTQHSLRICPTFPLSSHWAEKVFFLSKRILISILSLSYTKQDFFPRLRKRKKVEIYRLSLEMEWFIPLSSCLFQSFLRVLHFYLQRQRRSTIVENCCCCWDKVKLPAALGFLMLLMSFFLLLLLLGNWNFCIAIDNLMGHGLPLQLGPIDFAAGRWLRFRLVSPAKLCFTLFTFAPFFAPCCAMACLLLLLGPLDGSSVRFSAF